MPFSHEKTGLKGETYYLVWGDVKNSDKTPLICVHGGPGATHNYLLPISLIYEDFGIPVVMYDQIGCGQSTHFRNLRGDTKTWTPDLFMDEFEMLMDHLGIKTYDFLGQSWGGMLGGQFALQRQPKNLRKLIISDSPSSMIQWVKTANHLRTLLPKDVQETLTRCEKEGKTDTDEYEEAVMVYYRHYVCRLKDWPSEVNDAFAALKDDDTVYWTMNGPSEFYVSGSLKTWSIDDGLKEITEETCPGGMLVINGYWDEAQDETCVKFFTEPKCRTKWVKFALSGHMPMCEETERYVADLGSFLTSE